MAEMIELEKKEEFFSGEIFTRSQIIRLAVKYRLKFLASEHYKAYIDPKIVLDIKELERSVSVSMTREQAIKRNTTVEELEKQSGDINWQLDAHQLKTKFFILAPARCFNTEKTKLITSVPDPIMFYTDDNKHFRLIRKWGSDFTVFRRVLGFITKTLFRHLMLLYIIPIISISLYLSITYDWWFMAIVVIVALICVFTFGPGEVEIDDDFSGERYVTSIKSFYM